MRALPPSLKAKFAIKCLRFSITSRISKVCAESKSRSLWASLATALNDSLEVRHGISIAEEVLEDRLRREVTEYDLRLLEFLRAPSAAPAEVRYEIFSMVVSFCSHCDRSGQWLHYGRSGRGFAIGFSSEGAKALGYDLIQVDYSPDSQRRRMASLIGAGAQALKLCALEARNPEEAAKRALGAAHIVSLHMPGLAIRMKHPAFREEEEWRLVGLETSLDGVRQDLTGDSTPLEYRRSGGRLIPYEVLSFEPTARDILKEIVVGYSSETAPDAIQIVAQQYKLRPVIRRSDVPVR